MLEPAFQKLESWTSPYLGKKRLFQSIFKQWRDDVFSNLGEIIFTEKHEEMFTCVSRYVGVDIFLSGSSSSWKIVLVFSLILEGFVYSEENVGLGCVLKKRCVGLICGVWNYWVGPSEQGAWQAGNWKKIVLVISLIISHDLNSCLDSIDTRRAQFHRAPNLVSCKLAWSLHMIYKYFYSSEFLEKVSYLPYVFVIQHNF